MGRKNKKKNEQPESQPHAEPIQQSQEIPQMHVEPSTSSTIQSTVSAVGELTIQDSGETLVGKKGKSRKNKGKEETQSKVETTQKPSIPVESPVVQVQQPVKSAWGSQQRTQGQPETQPDIQGKHFQGPPQQGKKGQQRTQGQPEIQQGIQGQHVQGPPQQGKKGQQRTQGQPEIQQGIQGQHVQGPPQQGKKGQQRTQGQPEIQQGIQGQHVQGPPQQGKKGQQRTQGQPEIQQGIQGQHVQGPPQQGKKGQQRTQGQPETQQGIQGQHVQGPPQQGKKGKLQPPQGQPLTQLGNQGQQQPFQDPPQQGNQGQQPKNAWGSRGAQVQLQGQPVPVQPQQQQAQGQRGAQAQRPPQQQPPQQRPPQQQPPQQQPPQQHPPQQYPPQQHSQQQYPPQQHSQQQYPPQQYPPQQQPPQQYPPQQHPPQQYPPQQHSQQQYTPQQQPPQQQPPQQQPPQQQPPQKQPPQQQQPGVQAQRGAQAQQSPRGQPVPVPVQQQQPRAQAQVQHPSQGQETDKLYVVQRNPLKAGPKTGRKIVVETNYFPLEISPKKEVFHYDVTIEPDLKRFKFEVMKKFFVKYFPGRFPVFDGMKNMYSCGILPQTLAGMSGEVEILEPNKAKPLQFKVTVKKVADVDFKSLLSYMKTGTSLNTPQAAIQCVDVVLRYGPLCRFVKVGRSIFSPPIESISLGGGMEMWHGSFQSAVIKSKPLLNFDIAHKGFPKGQRVLDLCAELVRFDLREKRQPLKPYEVSELATFLRQLRIEYQIPNQSASKRTCVVNDLVANAEAYRFEIGGRSTNMVEYYKKEKNYRIEYPNLPCLWVGPRKSDMKVCYPLELCTIVSGQAIIRKLDGTQTSNMIKISTAKADERKRKIMSAFKALEFSRESAVNEFGIKIGTQFENVSGRVIPPPSLGYSGRTITPRDGVWRGGRFVTGANLEKWIILSVCRVDECRVYDMVDLLVREGRQSGMNISNPTIEMSDYRALQENIMKAAKDQMQLVMVIFDDYSRDNQYAKIKQFAELRYGVLTQCIKKVTVERKMNQATACQLLLKINAKLDHTNHVLGVTPKCLNNTCLLLGADVTHPPPGLKQSSEPSIAAVAASHSLNAFKYNISLRLQPSKTEMIEDLRSMIKEQLVFFRKNTGKVPQHIIMFRDGVSEGQFEQVLRIELKAMKAACSDLSPMYSPKITYLVVQKRHHTRFFPSDSRDGDKNMNVPVGTCIDSDITHPTEFEFFLLSHSSIRGIARPTLYHKLWDDADMSDTEVEELAYYLCHMFTRCNRSVSYPTPTYYAHLAAARAKVLTEGQTIDMDNLSAEQSKISVMEQVIKNRPMFFV